MNRLDMNGRAVESLDEFNRLDLLVDDELAEGERRRLLEVLQARPDGWRHCALAFLEAQSWKRQMRSMVSVSPGDARPALHEASATVLSSPAESSDATPAAAGEAGGGVTTATVELRPERLAGVQGWRARWNSTLAMAASFVLAFALGLMGRGIVSPRATNVVGPSAGGAHVALNQGDAQSTQLADDSEGEQWSNLTFQLAGDGDQPPRQLEVPVLASDKLDEDWLTSSPPAISEDIVRELHDRGHRVYQARSLLPVLLDDGREALFPVDDVQVVPVSNSSY